MSDIKIPLSAADEIPTPEESGYVPPLGDPYIPNLYKDKEYLTVLEALDQISKLSGFIMADHYRREHDGRRSEREQGR